MFDSVNQDCKHHFNTILDLFKVGPSQKLAWYVQFSTLSWCKDNW